MSFQYQQFGNIQSRDDFDLHSQTRYHNILLPEEQFQPAANVSRGTSIRTVRDDQSLSHHSRTPDLIQFTEAPPIGIVAQRFSEFLNSQSAQNQHLLSMSSSTFTSRSHFEQGRAHNTIEHMQDISSSISVPPNVASTPFGCSGGGENHPHSHVSNLVVDIDSTVTPRDSISQVGSRTYSHSSEVGNSVIEQIAQLGVKKPIPKPRRIDRRNDTNNTYYNVNNNGNLTSIGEENSTHLTALSVINQCQTIETINSSKTIVPSVSHQGMIVPHVQQTVIPNVGHNDSNNDLPGVHYSKILEQRYGLKPETAASLIPVFQPPCCLWADKVRRVLEMRGFTNLQDPWLNYALLPFVLSRLPATIANLVPTATLLQLLDYLGSYDRRKNNLHEVITKTQPLAMKPSAAFLQKCHDMRRAQGPDLPENVIQQLAWQALNANLPSSLQAYALTIKGTDELPTLRQWEVLDNLYFDSLPKTPALTGDPSHALANLPKNNNIKRRKNQQFNNIPIQQLSTENTQIQSSSNPNNSNVQKLTADFTIGIALKDRGVDLRRYMDAPYPHRTDMCFYHQAFGKQARKCTSGCAWINRTNIPLTMVPPKKPMPISNKSSNNNNVSNNVTKNA